MKVPWWVQVIALAGGFLIGRASVPAPDLRRADSLEVTQPGHDAGRDSTRRLVDSLTQESNAAAEQAAHAARLARAAGRAGAQAQKRAEALEDSLVRATSAADSVPILVSQKAALSQAVDSLRASADSFETAYQREKFGRELLVATVERQERQITADSLREVAYRRTVKDLRRAADGCRVPLTRIRCPQVSATWDVSDRGVLVNVTYPVGSVFGVGVSYRVAR